MNAKRILYLIFTGLTFVILGLSAACQTAGRPVKPAATPTAAQPSGGAGGDMSPGVVIKLAPTDPGAQPTVGQTITLQVSMQAAEEVDEATLVLDLPPSAQLAGPAPNWKGSLKNRESRVVEFKVKINKWPLEKPVRVTLKNPSAEYSAEWPQPRSAQPASAGEVEMMPGVLVNLTSDPVKPAAGQPFTLTAAIDPKMDGTARGVFHLPPGAQPVNGSSLVWQGSLKNGQAITVQSRAALSILEGSIIFELTVDESQVYTATLDFGPPLKDIGAQNEPRMKAIVPQSLGSPAMPPDAILIPPPGGVPTDAMAGAIPPVSLTVARKDITGDHFALTIYIMANQDAQGVTVITTPPAFLTLTAGADAWQGDLANGQVVLLEPEYTRTSPVSGDLVVNLSGAEPYHYPVPALPPGAEAGRTDPRADSGPVIQAATITYYGYFYYDEELNASKRTPAYFSLVDVYDSDGGLLGSDDYICSSYVGPDGRWECSGSADDGLFGGNIEPYAVLRAYHNYWVSVRDTGNNEYRSNTPQLSVDPNVPATYNMGSWLPAVGAVYFDGAHHMVKTLAWGWGTTHYEGGEDQPRDGQSCFLINYWPNGTDGSWQSGCTINIAGPGSADPDEWDETVVLHESGHYLMEIFADLDPPNVSYCHDPGETPPNCGHSFNSHEDQPTAYIEGWADYYQSAVKSYYGLPNPTWYEETTWHVDLETSWHPVSGTWDDAESTIAGILWDLNDGPADDANSDGVGDTLNFGHGKIHDIFSRYDPPNTHNTPWNIYEFYTGFVGRYGNTSGVIKDYFEHGINLDFTAPGGSMILESGSTYTRSNPLLVLSNITDAGVGMKEMRISIDLGATWSNWSPYTPSLSVTVPAGDGTKWVYAQYRDYAGNTSITYSDSIILDQTRPAGSISINSGAAYTNSLTVTLTTIASDNLSGMASRRFSMNGTDWSGWEAYTSSRSYTLAAGEGNRYVYVQYLDNAGNISQAFSDTIIIDTVAPVGSISIDNGAMYALSNSVTLTLSATDATSGVYQMRLRNGSDAWGAYVPFAASRMWTLPAGDGVKQVDVQFTDNAGNASSTYSDSITLDTLAPTCQVRINNGDAWTRFLSVQLSPGSSDAGSGVQSMRFSNSNTTWPDWTNYSSSNQGWSLSGPDGVKYVYAQFRDRTGRVSDICSDTIVLDTTPPQTSIANPLTTRAASFPVSWSGLDNFSGIATYDLQVKMDNGAWQNLMIGTTTTSITFTGALPGHVYYFRARANDRAGNISSFIEGDHFTLYATNFVFLPILLR